MDTRSNSLFDSYMERDLLPAGGLSAVAQTGSGTVRLRNEVSRLREQWQSVPFPSRIMGVAVTVFAVVAVLLGSMIGTERTESLPTYAAQPQFLNRIAFVLESLVLEESASNQFLSGSGTAAALLSARVTTDEAITSVLSYFVANAKNLRLSVSGSDADPTIESELQEAQLLEVRGQIYPAALLGASVASRVYSSIVARLASYYMRLASRLNSPTPADVTWRVTVASSAVLHAMLRDRAASQLLSLSSNADVFERGATATLVRNEQSTVEFLLQTLLGAALPYTGFTEFALHKGAAEADGTFQRLATTPPLSPTPASGWTVTRTQWNDQVTDPVSDLAGDIVSKLVADRTGQPVVDVYQPEPAMLALTCILCTFVAAAAGYGVLHRLTDKRYAAEIHAAHVMREAIVRVTEYAYSFESFDLSPPPAPEGMMGTPTGEIELALGRCLAGLKALAAFLPPALLPFRNADALKQVEAVRQIERGQASLTRHDRTFVKTSSLQLYAPEDIVERPSHDIMTRLTELQLRPTYVYCLTLDLSEIHRSVNSNKGSIEHVALVYPRFVEQFEEVVLAHDGVLSVLWMDQVIAVWNTGRPSAETAVNVTHAASAVVHKLNTLRRLSPDKLPSFRVHLGLTAGEVFLGVFGNDEFKTMQFFGAPIARGHQYASVNAFHSTAIACDEAVKDHISHAFACKPIEILPAFGSAADSMGQSAAEDSRQIRSADQTIAYEVISGAGKKEDDLATRLAMYRRAFDLFAQGYYREALKAFRGYTKQYGYDRSVERIQAVMTGE